MGKDRAISVARTLQCGRNWSQATALAGYGNVYSCRDMPVAGDIGNWVFIEGERTNLPAMSLV
jgi:hypothetical protein